LNAIDFQIDLKPLFAGWRVARFARVSSTNDEARRSALAGDAGRLWVVAEEQTHGRGRKGRFWSSPPGNLYASALIVDPCPSALAPQIGFVAGVALAQAVEDLGGFGFGLKWPNDLMWRGAKIAGLLAEGVTTPDRRLACIVGVGVNCVSAPDGLDYPAASLSDALAQAVSADTLFVRLATRFHEALGLWARGAGFAAIRALWLANAAGLGGPIRVADPRGAREGAFEGLDEGGRLLLRTPAGVDAIEAADLYLAPTAERPGSGGEESPRS
jgi:BirA family biotin operon repressor/biotin-[acetyl-CoA-carboxylase] ligase